MSTYVHKCSDDCDCAKDEPARQPDQRLDSMDPIASDLLVRLQRCEAELAAREQRITELEAELEREHARFRQAIQEKGEWRS